MYHVTADGTRMHISSMDDTHLKNTIRLLLKSLEEATNKLNDSGPSRLPSAREAALYGDARKITPEAYQRLVFDAYDKLGPYAVEAQIRNLDSDLFSKAFGRDSRDTFAPEGEPTYRFDFDTIMSRLRAKARDYDDYIDDRPENDW
jgi:hypothetical protein